jgi:DNA-binding XRE family transcriptional regulator
MIALLLVSALAVSNHTIGELQRAQPQPEVTTCFTIGRAVMLSAHDTKVNGHHINVQQFDADGDGEIDFQLIYEYVGTRGLLRPFPTVYQFDTKHAGAPDREYIDTKGDGRCADMVPIPLGSAFTGKRVGQ